MPYLTPEAGKHIVRLLLLGMVCFLILCGYVFWTGYEGRKDQVNNSRAGCERGKLDRRDNADFQNAHKEYIDKVVLAQSVKEDVKRAAREAVAVYDRTAPSLTERSKINCEEAFPNAKLIP